jgi:CRP-like cAMP-binding protein
MEKGELGLEMYFIIDGDVEVLSGTGEVIVSMHAGTPFGEMALLNPTPSVRTAHIRAATDVSLAVLSLAYFKFIMQKYPDFARKVRK